MKTQISQGITVKSTLISFRTLSDSLNSMLSSVIFLPFLSIVKLNV